MVGVMRQQLKVPLTVGIAAVLHDRHGTDRYTEYVRVMVSRVQAIIRLKCIHELRPHYISPVIPYSLPSMIPNLLFVPHGTSPYILLTIWYRVVTSGCGRSTRNAGRGTCDRRMAVGCSVTSAWNAGSGTGDHMVIGVRRMS